MFDPSFRSCTKFIAHIARSRFDFFATDLEELVKWADIVDGALYADARSAVEMNEPAMKLTLVIEGEFNDHRGRFAAGDVSVADETLDHRPVAASHAPCICFSILFAPISLSGPIPRLVGDILGI